MYKYDILKIVRFNTKGDNRWDIPTINYGSF